jgi:hypothetical protein
VGYALLSENAACFKSRPSREYMQRTKHDMQEIESVHCGTGHLEFLESGHLPLIFAAYYGDIGYVTGHPGWPGTGVVSRVCLRLYIRVLSRYTLNLLGSLEGTPSVFRFPPPQPECWCARQSLQLYCLQPLARRVVERARLHCPMNRYGPKKRNKHRTHLLVNTLPTRMHPR